MNPTPQRATVEADLSGIGIRLTGLAPGIAERLRRDWSAFIDRAGVAAPFLSLDFAFAAVPFESGRAYEPKSMESRLGADGARYRMREGSAEIDHSGAGRVELAAGQGPREYFTVLNFVRACLAWRLPSREGALVHAAGLVVDGRAFVLVGAEGSGKSTWARLGEAGGAHVLSDDLVLLDRVGTDPEVLGTPFHSTHPAAYRRGRWPLAALLFPVRGADGSGPPVSTILAQARITANLPFLAEGTERDPRIAALVERLCSAVPCVDFRFALDSPIVERLRAWP